VLEIHTLLSANQNDYTQVAKQTSMTVQFLTRALVASRKLHVSSRKIGSLKRFFFASSTDHSTLLSNATAHRILQNESNPNGPRKYILVPDGTPLDLAKKVDKLHLARLSADGSLIFHAKVVQRSLGSHAYVCKPLLDMALTDASSKGEAPQALASLEGLCKAISGAIQNEGQDVDKNGSNISSMLAVLKANDSGSYEAIKSIATGIPREGHSVVGQGTYRDGEQGWKELAKEYVSSGLSIEAQLYLTNGGKLIGIEHLADMSREGLMDAGGSLAKFQF